MELLKGASGFMYGFGNPGGTVNYVTKQPDRPVHGQRGTGLPLVARVDRARRRGGRAGLDNMFGYRLNLTHEEGKPSNAVGINRNSVLAGPGRAHHA